MCVNISVSSEFNLFEVFDGLMGGGRYRLATKNVKIINRVFTVYFSLIDQVKTPY